jgi:hypothetical protein
VFFPAVHGLISIKPPFLNLPEEMLVHIAQYLDYKSLKNLMGVNSSFYDLGKEPQVQKALKTREVKALGLLDRIGMLEPAQLYTAVSIEEIKASARENREPNYLETIHKAYGIQLRKFLGGRAVGESREDRIRHGFNLICLLIGINSTCLTSGNHLYTSWLKAQEAALKAFYPTLSHTVIVAVQSASSSFPCWDWDARQHAIMDVFNISPGISNQKKRSLVGRIIELTALLSILKFSLSQGFFSHIYEVSNQFLVADLPGDLSIWESQEAWEAFYAKYFGSLTPESLAFLTPFLDEIDKTRLAILNSQS